jgi:hypothetical protein
VPPDPTQPPFTLHGNHEPPTPPDPDPDPDDAPTVELIELDDEIDALQTAITCLDPLTPQAQHRILIYLCDRYLLNPEPDTPPQPNGPRAIS